MNKKVTKRDGAFALKMAKRLILINELGGECNKCKEKDFFKLDFHHEKDKFKTIHDLSNNRLSKLKEEASKCILLCANCHAELHSNGVSRNHNTKESILKKLLHSFKCENCGYKGNNLASLDFHHEKNKKFGLNQGIHRKVKTSLNEIYDEIKKCKVLCKNCHRKEHFDFERYERLKDLIDYKIKNYSELMEPLDKEEVLNMYFEKKMKQVEIAKHFGCGKSTICGILKKQDKRSNKKLKEINCKFCNNIFMPRQKCNMFCSNKCKNEYKRKHIPERYCLEEMMKTKSFSEIGEHFDVSRVTAWKWAKKYNLI
jgi:predicted DNA-binding protein YlxM (UPF0122 family)